MAGEIARSSGGIAPPRGAWHIIKSLGLVGLYKVGKGGDRRTTPPTSSMLIHLLPAKKVKVIADIS